MARRIPITQLALLCVLSLAQFVLADPPAEETRWGDLTGQLIYDGEPPKRKRLKLKEGFPKTWDESLVVDPKTHGLKNVFVYLHPGGSVNETLQIHPDHLKQAKKPVKWTVDERGFKPHAILLQTNQPLLLTHGPEVAFNVKLDLFRNGAVGVLTPPTATAKYQFTRTESLPGRAGCNIHFWFNGYLLILDHPYAAITDKQGKFTIKNLPAGEHEFKFWQEKTGYVELPEIRLRDSDLEGDRKRGRLIIDIKPGDNDLGEIKIDPQVFE